MTGFHYHEDSDIRVNNQRCAGIIVKDERILLMFRRRNGYKYYTTPGGHRRKGESKEETVIREVDEEMSIEVSDPELVFEFHDHRKDVSEYFCICKWISGEPELGGEEKVKLSEENYYEPMWVELNEVEKINLLPKAIKEWIMESLI